MVDRYPTGLTRLLAEAPVTPAVRTMIAFVPPVTATDSDDAWQVTIVPDATVPVRADIVHTALASGL